MSNIPFLDLGRQFNEKELDAITFDIRRILSSGKYLFGSYSQQLEKELSILFESEAVLVGSGTDALCLSLMALGIGPDSRVIVPAYSAIPTAIAVKMIGATPVYVDIDYTGTLSSDALIKEIISSKDIIDAVIVVHLYGNCANMEKITEICNCHNIPIIEDCAQSFGTRHKNGKLTGTIGSIGAFSFYPTKNIGCCGDSGFVLTNNSKLAQKVRELRFYGQKSSYVMGDKPGMNSRTDEIQCAILLHKLSGLKDMVEGRKEMLKKYVHGLKHNAHAQHLKWSENAVPHILPIFHPKRRLLQSYLKESCGIETGMHYPFVLPECIDNETEIEAKYPIANYFKLHELSLPFNPWLTNSEVYDIIEALRSCLNMIGECQ